MAGALVWTLDTLIVSPSSFGRKELMEYLETFQNTSNFRLTLPLRSGSRVYQAPPWKPGGSSLAIRRKDLFRVWRSGVPGSEREIV